MAKDSIKLGDKDYALVPARLKKFREENTYASIDSNPTYNEDGSITFKTTIIKDQRNDHSAKGTGSARYTAPELQKAKQFEKLETISIGRALANLGYLNDGQVATTEEMDEFNDYRDEKKREAIRDAVEAMDSATTLEELRDGFIKSNLMQEPEVVAAKDKRKGELSDESRL